MADIRFILWLAISCIVLFGTAYSALYSTYLDTSNPLLAHLPHPLGHTYYFATKSNFLNVYFIKIAWGWTSAAFFLLWFTSPPGTRTGGRLAKWVLETGVWLVFTTWFFGPALLDRVVIASGGECLLSLPSGDHVQVPTQYCVSKSFLSPASHPELFQASSLQSFVPPIDWHARPRLRRGHDVSGHIFLLTMSVLFLADQLRYVFRPGQRSTWHTVAIAANVALIGTWLLASWTTSLYYHAPFEKFTGYRV
jgi:Inositol phospholipid synthesis and fat-storage-inducing TM